MLSFEVNKDVYTIGSFLAAIAAIASHSSCSSNAVF